MCARAAGKDRKDVPLNKRIYTMEVCCERCGQEELGRIVNVKFLCSLCLKSIIIEDQEEEEEEF